MGNDLQNNYQIRDNFCRDRFLLSYFYEGIRMNREQTQAAIIVMQAYVDGAEIQVRGSTAEWTTHDLDVIPWQWSTCEYRVNTEPREFLIEDPDDHPCVIEGEPMVRVYVGGSGKSLRGFIKVRVVTE